MTRTLSRLAVLPVLAALVLAGCGGDDDDSSGSTTPKPTTTAAQGGGAAATVSMKNIEYIPKEITATAGQKITWTNDDSVAHTVTKEQGVSGGPESGTLDPGDTFSFSTTKVGKIPYFCEIHPNQKGTIVIAK